MPKVYWSCVRASAPAARPTAAVLYKNCVHVK